MNRTWKWLAALTILASVLLCGSALADQSGSCGSNVRYTLSDDGVLTISGSGQMGDYNEAYKLPDGYYTTAPWGTVCDDVEHVVIANGVTDIGSFAFFNCLNLKSVTIADSVTIIGKYAFCNCYQLKNVIVPYGVISIGSGAFKGSGLTSISIPDSVTYIGEEAFFNCDLPVLSIPSSVTGFGNYIIGNSELISISIPGHMDAAVMKDTYTYCPNLTSVSISEGSTEISKSLFKDCSRLTDITIPDSVTSIGKYAFEGCSGLTSVTIPDSVTSIGYNAFNNCRNLTDLHLSSIEAWVDISFESYYSNPGMYAENWYIDGMPITWVTIPDGITSIPDYAFVNCTTLERISLSSGVVSIGERAFKNCSSLQTVYVPSSVVSIGASAFDNCTSLLDLHIDSIEAWPYISFGDALSHPNYYARSWYINGLPVTSAAVPNGVTTIDDYTFRNCSTLTNVSIPDSVTSIGNSAFEGCSGLTSVTIPDSVTSIGHEAFYGCSGLTSITIPNSVTSIGNYAFNGCSGLTSVTIPDSVTSIGDYAFRGCSGLTSVTIPDSVTSIVDGAFNGCSGLTSVTIPDSVTSIGNYAFCGCSGLTSVTIPDSVTSIGYEAFYNCSGLTSVTIPDSVTSIGYKAFYNCSGLTSVTIPDSVASIGEWAFSGCSGLTSVTIPDSVTSIGNYAFYGCSGLTSVSIPDGVAYIRDRTFSGCSGLTSVTIPDSVTSIGNYAFNGCSKLTIVTIPNSVTSIGNSAFNGCAGLTGVTIPDSVTSIGYDAFQYCSGLTSITIPDSVTSIGSYTFYGCSGLTSVTIPDSITSIGDSAFNGCSSLTDVYYTGTEAQAAAITVGSRNAALTNALWHYETINGTCGSGLTWILSGGVLTVSGVGEMDHYTNANGAPWKAYSSDVTGVVLCEGVTSVGNYAFTGCTGLASITIPDSVTSIGISAFAVCSGLTDVYADSLEGWLNISFGNESANPNYYAEHFHINGDLVTSVTFPDTVTGIPAYAFSGCSGLTSVTIPDSVTSLGDYAFAGCTALTSVTVPGSVTSVAGSVFRDCTGLTEVILQDGVTGVGSHMFDKCSGLTVIVLPDSTVRIGEAAFWLCSGLTEVTLPSSVTTIVENAFNGCGSLAHVYYAGTEAQAAAITVGSYNDHLLNAVWHYSFAEGTCGDGLTWTLLDGILTVSGSGEMDDYTSDIGAPWAAYKTAVTGVVLGDGVTSVGSWAFYNCSGAASVTIPDSVTSVGSSAFDGCSGLSDVYAGSLEGWLGISFADNKANPNNYADHFHMNGDLVTSVVIPNSVTSIGDYAFSGCSGLTGVTIPDSVTSIGSSAFCSCSVLTAVEIPDSVTSINDYTFENCSGLTSVTIPDSVASIGQYAFQGCDALADVWYGGTLEQWNAVSGADAIPSGAALHYVHTHVWGEPVYTWSADHSTVTAQRVCTVDAADVETETVSASASLTGATCTEAGRTVYTSAAFANPAFTVQVLEAEGDPALGHDPVTDAAVEPTLTSAGLTEGCHCGRCGEVLTAQEKILEFSTDAYPGITLRHLYTGDTHTGLEVIGADPGITSAVLPDCVTGIADSAFAGCAALTEITVPAGVTSIGNAAFSGCTGLERAAILSYNAVFGTDVFSTSPVICCYEYSEADFWAAENAYTTVYLDGPDAESVRTVTLEPDFELECGRARTLACSVFPADGTAVAWTSSDPAVARVLDGTVTALTPGTAVITATAGGASAQVRVECFRWATDFTFAESEIWVLSKTAASIGVITIPENSRITLSWTSADTAYATVDENGLLTAVRPGDVTVTAALGETEHSCLVHVCYPVTAAAFAQDSVAVTAWHTAQLTLNVTMRTQSCVNRLVTFSSSDETVASVDQSGLVTGVGAGTAVITATAGSGVTAQCTVTVQIGNVLTLPARLTVIESEAFANLSGVDAVAIPATVTQIADDAFAGSDIVILAPEGSYAAEWAADHGLRCAH